MSNVDPARRIALVSMPFGPVTSPSIGLSLLRGVACEAGWNAEIHYFTAAFAAQIGASAYSAISDGAPANHDLAGEFIFASCVSRLRPSDEQTYIERVLRGADRDHDKARQNLRPVTTSLIEAMRSARAAASAFVDECVDALVAREPRVVGFTSVFQQNVASLAVAERLKKRRPDVFVVFGGANCEDVMGEALLETFDFVDVVVSGEGEEAFRNVLANLEEEAGAVRRQVVSAPPRSDLNTLPIPEFDDYFAQCDAAGLDLGGQQRLMFESARGCWWGQKHHCTFCGLNGGSMPFRSKSPERAVAELITLAERHPGLAISVVDNILDHRYLGTVLPELARVDPPMRLFWEVKANLSKEQLRVMKSAGIDTIQPGIESLSDEVLQLMRKGIRGIRNVQLLKWCLELGIEVEWNILWGFPGESTEAYETMADVVGGLTHLTPPHGGNPIRLDRFSPNFEEPERFGLTSIHPYPAYEHVYGLDRDTLARLAYFFAFDYAAPADVCAYTARLRKAIEEWKQQHASSACFFVDKDEQMVVFDLRDPVEVEVWGLDAVERAIYLAFDAATTAEHAYAAVRDASAIDESEFTATLERMVANRLILRDGEHYLGLVVPIDSSYSPSAGVLERLMATATTTAVDGADDVEFAMRSLKE